MDNLWKGIKRYLTWKTIYEAVALLFFFAVTLVIFIGAYATQQIDMWIVAALMVMILWKVYERVCDNFKRRKQK